MSAELARRVMPGGLVLDDRTRHVLRYATGPTLAMAMAMVFAWPLSYIAPLLCLTFLAAPKPRPSLREGLLFLGVLAGALAIGLWSIRYLLASEFAFFAGFGLILLRVFYAQCSGASPILILWLLISILVLPMVAVQSPELAVLISQALFTGAAVSLVAAWVAYAIFPESRNAPKSTAEAAPLPSARVRLAEALERMVVVYPMFVLFHVFEWSGAMLVLIFVALLSIQPGFAENFKGGIALILGNTMGGLAAIAGFNLLTVVPELSFFLALCFFGGLYFGNRLTGGSKLAPVFGMAFSTMLLILGSTTSGDGEAGSAAYMRILQIMIAVVYVVSAFGFLRRWRKAGGS